MIRIPDEIIQRLIMHCQSEEIGLAQLGNDEVTLIIMGGKDLSPDQAAIIAAHILLTGVLSGGFMEDNRKRAENEGNLPKTSLN